MKKKMINKNRGVVISREQYLGGKMIVNKKLVSLSALSTNLVGKLSVKKPEVSFKWVF